MIQRIQTLFLFLASCAGGGQFALPYLSADAGNPATTLPVLADSVFNPLDNPGLIGLCALGTVVSLAAIFLFRNRSLQGRITGGAMLVSVLTAALLGFSLWQLTQSMPEGGLVHYQAGLALPVVGLIFQWLAGRSIRKDEALVRSMDRLR
jgi:hypothetical protein